MKRKVKKLYTTRSIKKDKKDKEYMEANYCLYGTLEMMSDHFQLIDLDLSLPSIQGTRMSS